jgi:hypothetical protein
MTETKLRSRFLTVFLIVLMISELWDIWSYFFRRDLVLRYHPTTPGWVFPWLAIYRIINLAGFVALFRWKKWGFFVLVLSSVLAFIVRLEAASFPPLYVLSSLGLAPLLYGLLKFGKPNVWSQLE